MRLIDAVDRWLVGTPEHLITIGLILAGIIAWIIAIYGRPAFKVAALAWIIAP
jgi:hypothetical protein